MFRLVVFTVFLSVTSSTFGAPAYKRSIERSVSALVAQYSDGIAVGYPQYRHIRFGRVFGGDSG